MDSCWGTADTAGTAEQWVEEEVEVFEYTLGSRPCEDLEMADDGKVQDDLGRPPPESSTNYRYQASQGGGLFEVAVRSLESISVPRGHMR